LQTGRQDTAEKTLEGRGTDIQQWAQQSCRHVREERQAFQGRQAGQGSQAGRLDQACIQVGRQGRAGKEAGP
jgi:hypothetical protein